MKDYNMNNLRNIGIIGHSSSGKTSLTEALLFYSETTDRLGNIEDGTTMSDFEQEEKTRKISISASINPLEWSKIKINLVDMPGYFDFVGESIEGMRAVDVGMIVVCGVAGVQVGTEKAWDYCNRQSMPRTFFINKLDRDKDLLDRFKDRITINVTEFYRNPNMWDNLRSNVIPYLLKTTKNKKLTIWSAGCSTGEEPYSLAMLLDDEYPNTDWKILATDLDEFVLKKSKAGRYSSYQVNTLDEKKKKKYLKEVPSSQISSSEGFLSSETVFEISPELKKKIEFKQHNLLEDKFPTDIDLILCRNVVIYFTEETKSELYQRFSNSLWHEGVLIIGNTEHIVDYRSKGFEKMADWTFNKVHGGN